VEVSFSLLLGLCYSSMFQNLGIEDKAQLMLAHFSVMYCNLYIYTVVAVFQNLRNEDKAQLMRAHFNVKYDVLFFIRSYMANNIYQQM